MSKVVVGLWSRDTKVKRNFSHETLNPLKLAVIRTHLMAKERAAESAALRSIFVAPEFLFTQPKQGHTGTTAMTKSDRNSILLYFQAMSNVFKDMLLVPGTIVFKEEITPESAKKAMARLQHAHDWKKSKWDKTATTYHTKEVESGKAEDFRDYYTQQIKKLDPGLSTEEKNRIVTNPRVLRQSFLIKNQTYAYFNSKKFTYGKKTNMDDFSGDTEQGIYVPGKQQGVMPVGDKLKVGFEVCYEHELGILGAHLAKKDLDLHIIMSAEVPNFVGQFCTKESGFVLHASSNPDFSGVFRKQKGLGGKPILQYKEVPKGKQSTDMVGQDEVYVSETTIVGKDHGKTVETLYAKIKMKIPGWDNVECLKEIDHDGGPLRFYEIDLV